MNEKPILFNTEMVKAVLDGRKTQTRRVIKNLWDVMPPKKGEPNWAYGFKYYKESKTSGEPFKIKCPYGKVGDELWVRETFCVGSIDQEDSSDGHESEVFVDQCKGDNNVIPKEYCLSNNIGIEEVTWKPSIFMPRKYSRIQLKITDIRVERVQDMREGGVISEGIEAPPMIRTVEDVEKLWSDWKALWDSINKKRGFGWDKNPFVWVVEFEVLGIPTEAPTINKSSN